MSTEIEGAFPGRRMRVDELRERLRSRMGPTANVTVWRPGEVALLQALSSGELQKFARSIGAQVVPRAGGSAYEFSGTVVNQSSNS